MGLRESAISLAAGAPPELFPAREQMAVSLGWHIILACFGVAFPTMIFVMHRRGIARDDPDRAAPGQAVVEGVRSAVRDRRGVGNGAQFRDGPVVARTDGPFRRRPRSAVRRWKDCRSSSKRSSWASTCTAGTACVPACTWSCSFRWRRRASSAPSVWCR